MLAKPTQHLSTISTNRKADDVTDNQSFVALRHLAPLVFELEYTHYSSCRHHHLALLSLLLYLWRSGEELRRRVKSK